jgi:hypothetical protein
MKPKRGSSNITASSLEAKTRQWSTQPLLSLVLGTELDICIYGTTGHCRARDGTFALVAEAVIESLTQGVGTN